MNGSYDKKFENLEVAMYVATTSNECQRRIKKYDAT